ncbi:MAG TPA: hypothetical protein VGQ69_12435 [Gemmatimonadales bacterium]|jgi:hypothetical protein|nr:hypothetical protein [Gemmatimonadales bacterium]
MGKYWLKIGLGAALIFLVGFSVLSAGRHFRRSIDSDADITIPLGGFIPFKLDGVDVGKLRSLTIHRSAPKQITGFGISMRMSDSAMFEKLRSCRFSVTDPSHIDERTTFYCLQSDSGYREFGEIRMSLRLPDVTQTLVQPLLLPERAIQDFQRHGRDSVAPPGTDSVVSAVRLRVREQERAYNDSVTAARLEKRAKDMQRQADSLRNKVAKP